MREVTCAACDAKVPMGEAFSVSDRTLCIQCLEQFLAGQEKGTKTTQEIPRMIDPTICVHCAADSGAAEWDTLAGFPACTQCSEFFRNRPYPNWLKISFALFLCVAVAAFIYNWRFFMAYLEIVAGNHAMAAGEVEKGVHYLDSAAHRLPEIRELAVVPNLYNAQRLITQNQNDEALALLAKSRPYAPPDLANAFRMIELQAQIGVAFDKRDYDEFLKLSMQSAEFAPNEPSTLASVASAYACKYADTGDAEFRKLALEHLAKAKEAIGADSNEFAEYENRIQHRLETRQIISREQFKKQYPNGWKPEEAQ